MATTITAKGQMTIPKDIRDRMGLKPGDKVKLFVDSRGDARIVRVRPLSEISGMLRRPGQKAVTIEDMNEAVAAAAVERYERSLPAGRRPKRPRK